ncbi:MAG: glycosyltransferase family 4 protein [Actinomycetota bacterium]
MTGESPPSVAHLLWSGGTGGIARLVHQLGTCQQRSGMTVSICFAQARGPFAAAMRDSGLRVLDLELGSGYDLRPGRIRRAGRALAEFDLIHLHAFNLPLGAIAIKSGRPIVFTEHGNFGAGRKLGIAGRLRRLAQRRFLHRACAEIAANSNWTAHRMAALYGIDEERISVVHNGIDASRGGSAPARDPDGGIVVAFVGRLAGFKRVDRLLRALSQVQESERIRALIVGEGPLEGDLTALSSSLGCDSMVDFLGYRSDVEAILSASDVLVQPSQGEPFGLAIVEACRQGALPIVFADGGGALEVLPPDGRVVADESELAGVLDELVNDPTVRSDAARRARAQWAVERFPIDRTAAAYLTLYRSALERHRA